MLLRRTLVTRFCHVRGARAAGSDSGFRGGVYLQERLRGRAVRRGWQQLAFGCNWRCCNEQPRSSEARLASR